MLHSSLRGFTFVLLGASLLACQSTSPHEAFEQSQNQIRDATGQTAQWLGRSADEKQITDAVTRLLAAPLTIEHAVQIGLINNRTMQARFEELGIARADLVQAGLLKNPVFDAQIRWPAASPSGTNIEFAIVQDFISVLLIPMKKRIAAARLREAVHHVTHEAIALASDVRTAYVQLSCAQELLKIKEKDALAAEAAGDLSDRLFKAGNISELEHARRSAARARARIDLATAKSEAIDAREELTESLGLSDPDSYQIADAPPLTPALSVSKSALESLAVSRRQDLAAKREAAIALAKSLGLSKATALVPELNLGGTAERELDGNWLAGPTISLQIPLFDQGQAQVANADSQLRQARFEYAALENTVRSEVRTALNHIIASRGRLQLIDEQLTPQQDRLLEQTQLHNNGMLASTFELLETRQSQLESQAMRARTLADHWLALVALQRAIAGPLPPASSIAPTTQVSPSTPNAPTAPSAHDHHSH